MERRNPVGGPCVGASACTFVFALLVLSLWVVVPQARAGGSVAAWGWNSSQQATVPTGASGAVAVAAGFGHSLALRGDGTVVAWGSNDVGQATVPAGLGGVAALAAGSYHNLVIKRDGTVVAWGWNGGGQCSVPAGLSSVVAIAGGYAHSLALRTDGTVVAWGWNDSGQSTVPTGLSSVVAIAAGYAHSLALKSDGTVVAWGNNSSGQTSVPAGLSGVVAIAAGDSHCLALKSNGTVVAWGKNDSGQATVPGGLSGVVALSGGYLHSAALKSNGTVVAWGDNSVGQTTVPAGLSGVVAIAAGGGHNLALKADGRAVMLTPAPGTTLTSPAVTFNWTAGTGVSQYALWVGSAAGGYDIYARAETGQSQTLALPTDGRRLYVTLWSLMNGAWHPNYYLYNACRTPGKPGTLVAWGLNDNGQTNLPAGLTSVVGISAGGKHALALKSDGTVAAWGLNDKGQTSVPDGLSGIVAVAAGGSQSLALKNNGTVVGWGDIGSWQLTGIQFGNTGTNVLTVMANAHLQTNCFAVGGTAPYTYEVANPPPYNWWTIQTDGTMEFTPPQAGVFDTPVTIRDAAGQSLQTFLRLIVQTQGPGITGIQFGDTGSNVLAVRVNVYRQATCTAIGGTSPYTYEVANPPPYTWWTIWTDGTMEFTPPQTGVFDTSVTIRDSGGNSLQTYLRLVVGVGSPVTGIQFGSTGTNVFTAQANVHYVMNFSPIGGAPPYTYDLSDPPYHSWWNVRHDGTMEFTALNTGVYDTPVGIHDVDGNSLQTFLRLIVEDTPITGVQFDNTGSNLLTVQAGAYESRTFSAMGGYPPYTYELPDPLPYVWWIVRTNGTMVFQTAGPGVFETPVTIRDAAQHVLQTFLRLTVEASPAGGQALQAADQTTRYGASFGPAPGGQSAQLDTPPAAFVGFSNVVAIAAGYSHNLALKADGTVAAWGDNTYGQINLPSSLSDVVAIAAGGAHSLALKGDGTVVAWGRNDAGQATVPTGLYGVVAIAAGAFHSLALKADGTVVAWGSNSAGQTAVPAGLSGVIAIDAGGAFSLALKSTGAVVAWGDNSAGQTAVPAGLSDVGAISAGDAFSIAVKVDRRAGMISPAAGTTLTSSTVTFVWDSGLGISQYALWVGSKANTYDLYSGVVTGQSKTVTLPADGRTIYVTLWSVINGAWLSYAYTYTAYTPPPPAKAAITSPANGATLTSGTVTFNWNSGTGVTQYALWVGSNPSSYDLYAGVETGLSRTLTLPTDGRTLYVTLWSFLNGAWQSNAYTYTAYIPVVAPNTLPVRLQSLPASTLMLGAGAGALDLRAYFGLPGVSNQVAQFNTVLGQFNVELMAAAAPKHATNFTAYVNAGAYSNTFFHRSYSFDGGTPSIVQGGGYYATLPITTVPTNGPVALEYNLANTRGTLAAARTSNPDSATCEWFFNVKDNSTILGPDNGGGYTVFGRVIGTGMTVVDAIAAVPVYNAGSGFDTMPLRNIRADQTQIELQNFVTVNSVSMIPVYPNGSSSPAVLEFTAASSNAAVASVSISGATLTITPLTAGRTTITVRAADVNGNLATGSFEVTVKGTKAQMLTPAPGSTLASATTTFTWNAGAGVSSYALWVGSAPNGYDLYAGVVSGLTKTLTLPADGRQLYVTLMSWVNNTWESNPYTYTAYTAPPPVKAAMTGPADGATLTSGTVTFNWDSGVGVTQYALWVGSKANTYDLYAGVVTAQSKTLTLPVDGRKLYVTLWSVINGALQSNAYTYTAYTAPPPVRAAMINPANGTTLTSGAVLFEWDSGIGVTQYALWVGSTLNNYDLYAGVVAGQSKTVTLPVDGRTIYVTLWSVINGAWQSNAYTYTAYTAPAPAKAVMVSPVAGSTLASATTTFTWNGAGISQYALWVGNTPNSYDLYAAAETGQSRTLTLPTDGRTIYVTLWSFINNTWQSNAYAYTAFTAPGGPVKAQMLAPNPGSTLTAASTTFIWSAGTGVSSYALWVGSTPNSYDLYAGVVSGQTKTLSLPVDGRTIYVTLWSLINNNWQTSACQYTAFTGP